VYLRGQTTSRKRRGGGPSKMFPATWDPSSIGKKRKTRTFLEETDEKTTAGVLPFVEFHSDLQQTILRRLNQPVLVGGGGGACPSSSTDALLPDKALDHILARVPYRAMLENLFGNTDQQIQEVPILTKTYEESFMRQPAAGEQACAMGELCECMLIDRSAPFIAVELRLPNDSDQPQMCVLCSRAATQKCYYDMCYLNRHTKGLIQRYGVIFGQPGEYAVECVLVSPPAVGLTCMPVPSMSHQRNRYSVVCHGGIKSLRQHRVSFEDFQRPSSTGAV